MKTSAILGGVILMSTTLAFGNASVTPSVPVLADSVVEVSAFESNLNEVAVQTTDFAVLNQYKQEFSQLVDERIATNTKINAVNLEHFEKTPLNLAVESEGITVQFKNYVASPHNIFVWFDVILPEGDLLYKQHYSPTSIDAPFGSTDGTSHNFLVVNDEQVELTNYSTEVYWLNEKNSSSNTGSFLIEFCFDSPLQENSVFTMSWDGFYGDTSYSSLEDRFIVDETPQIISGQWECSIPWAEESLPSFWCLFHRKKCLILEDLVPLDPQLVL